MIVARLEATKDIKCILDKLENLEYDVSLLNEKTIFVYRASASSSDLSRDVKSAKSACKFSGTIKCSYGTNNSNY
jgi:hypothetical protein